MTKCVFAKNGGDFLTRKVRRQSRKKQKLAGGLENKVKWSIFCENVSIYVSVQVKTQRSKKHCRKLKSKIVIKIFSHIYRKILAVRLVLPFRYNLFFIFLTIFFILKLFSIIY